MVTKFLSNFLTTKKFFLKNQCDFKKLRKQGLRIFNKRRFNNFLNKYGKIVVLEGYARILQDENSFFLKKVSTNQIIKLVKFDKSFGNFILSYLLEFEQKFCNILINTILEENNLDDNYVLRDDNSDWLVFNNENEKENFFNSIYQNVSGCNFLKRHQNKSEIPLSLLSLSWTYFNLISLFEAIDLNTQEKIINNLGFLNSDVDVFKSILHITRRLRNTISHNDLLVDSKFEIYKSLIKKANLNAKKNYFYIYDICNILDDLNDYDSQHCIVSNLIKLIKKQKFNSATRVKVYQLLGFDVKEDVRQINPKNFYNYHYSNKNNLKNSNNNETMNKSKNIDEIKINNFFDAKNFKKNFNKFLDEKNPIVIDVRSKKEYDFEHLKNSLNIPIDEIKNFSIKTDDPIYVYCRSGKRSDLACKILSKKNYNAINIGGIIHMDKIHLIRNKKDFIKSKENNFSEIEKKEINNSQNNQNIIEKKDNQNNINVFDKKIANKISKNKNNLNPLSEISNIETKN